MNHRVLVFVPAIVAAFFLCDPGAGPFQQLAEGRLHQVREQHGAAQTADPQAGRQPEAERGPLRSVCAEHRARRVRSEFDQLHGPTEQLGRLLGASGEFDQNVLRYMPIKYGHRKSSGNEHKSSKA